MRAKVASPSRRSKFSLVAAGKAQRFRAPQLPLVNHSKYHLRENPQVSATISCPVSDALQVKRYFVSGAVQGVGFRYFTQDAAEKLHLSGYVRNLRDGRVEVFAAGTAQQLAQLRAILERGPRFASVRDVQEEDAAADAHFAKGFAITRDA
jgi:acylphosphatase